MGSKPNKPEPRDLKGEAAVWLAKFSLPSICLMVCIMVYCASGAVSGDALGIISALVSTVCLGLVNVISRMGSEQEDPMHSVAKSLIDGLERSEARSAAISDALIKHIQRSKTTELCVDDKTITIADGDTKASVRKGRK